MRVDLDAPGVDVNIGQRYTYRGQPFTGELYETDGSGQWMTLSGVRDGIPDGPHREWFPDGMPRAEILVVDGRARGTSRNWHDSPAVEREFDDNGSLMVVRRWAEDGSPLPPSSRSAARDVHPTGATADGEAGP